MAEEIKRLDNVKAGLVDPSSEQSVDQAKINVYIIQEYESCDDLDHPAYEKRTINRLRDTRRVSREEWESSPGRVEIHPTGVAYKRIYPEGEPEMAKTICNNTEKCTTLAKCGHGMPHDCEESRDRDGEPVDRICEYENVTVRCE